MEDSELLETLRDIGLTQYESSAYIAAVKLGAATPKQLVESSDVPQPRIYDIIDDLQEKGLVEVHEHQSGKQVRSPPPEVMLERFKERRMQAFDAQVDAVTTSLQEFHAREQISESSVTMISLRKSALRHMRNAIEGASWWLTVALPGDGYEELMDDLRAAAERGVNVRMLVDVDEMDFRSQELGDELPNGVAIRHRSNLDTFVFADRNYGIFNSISPRMESQPYIITQDTNLVLLFQSYAEQVWNGSKVLREDGAFPRRYLDPWRAIVDIRETLEEGVSLVATVEGCETHSRRRGRWTGEIIDYGISGPVSDNFVTVMPTTARLTIDTDEGELLIGGWKATIEDLAADGIVIDRE